MSPDQIQHWTLGVRIAEVIVSVLGIGGLILSLRQVGKTVTGNAFMNAFSELRELHKVFVSYPNLRPCFYDNEPMPVQDENYQRARSVAEMFLDAFVHMYLLRGRVHRSEQALLCEYVKLGTGSYFPLTPYPLRFTIRF
jgi:hypothetical protein